MQVKTTRKYHFTFTKIVIIQKQVLVRMLKKKKDKTTRALLVEMQIVATTINTVTDNKTTNPEN